MKTLAVVGAGAAGWAAAWWAVRAGARVHVFSRGLGALDFSSGLLDAGPRSVDLSPYAEEFLRDELEFVVAQPGEVLVVATSSGLLREVSGASRAVLDLGSVNSKRIGVLGWGSAACDEKALARSLSLEPFAIARGLSFEPFSAESDCFEEAESPRGFAERLDEDAAFRARMLERVDVRARELGLDCVLMSAWGGVATPLEKTPGGVRLGEISSNLEGVAGLRFDRLRRRFLERVTWSELNVERWQREGGRIVVFGGDERHEVDALVIATGGWLGGGVEWTSKGPRTALRGPEGLEPPRFDVASESGWDATRHGAGAFAAQRRLPLHWADDAPVVWAGEVLFPSSLGRVIEAGLRSAAGLLCTAESAS